MPIYRGPDGKIIEERTKKVSASEGRTSEGHTSKAPANLDFKEHSDSDKTQKVGSAPAKAEPAPAAAKVADQDKTRYVNLGNNSGNTPGNTNGAQPANSLSDPVVGWLVVIKGPGSGNALALGYGTNAIGRAETNRIRLEFGDDLISRNSHAVLTYDPRGRKFYIQQGAGGGLIYIDDQPVLTPRELGARTRILMGNTLLYFLPLCGDVFDWQELQEKSAG